MMHCTMEDLLALRAGEASVWARRHLDECPACRSELDAVYQRVAVLKALPALGPARDRWPVVRGAVREGRRVRRAWGAMGLAAAAALAGLIIFEPATPAPLGADELARLKEQSATLESELSVLASPGRVMSGREAAMGGFLEDRIALIDGELVRLGLPEVRRHDGQVMDLWRQRVDLMRQLYTVRATRAAYMGL
jgi:hypothetical protein